MTKTHALFVFVFFYLKHEVTYATIWSQKYTELNVYLQGFTLEASKVDTVFACYTKCEDNILCTSINMNTANKTCELKYSTKNKHPENIDKPRPNMIYMEIREHIEPGSGPDNPASSCKQLKMKNNQAKSGIYWMKFSGSPSGAFQVFCEMTIGGGGWTLVYSYTFTDYRHFHKSSNAVTPVPNWPVSWTSKDWPPQSTKIPLNESSYSAMDFALWKEVGNEYLFKSNITNWYACVEETGSIVNWKAGRLKCRMVNAFFTPSCTIAVPNQMYINVNCGPSLWHNGNKITYFDGKKTGCFPVHDPCGTVTTVTHHLKDVPDPSGAVYIRSSH